MMLSARPTVLRLVAATIAIALACGACSGRDESSPDRRSSAADQQWQQYAKVADSTAVTLDWKDRPDAPAGFTDGDMDTFAKAEVALIKKSIDPKVGRMSPDDAVDYVLADLPPQTRADYTSKVPKNSAAKHAWEWYLASMFAEQPTAPAKVIRVDWDTTTRTDKLDNGNTAPVLNVTLQVFVAHTFGPADKPRNVIVRRAVQLSGFKPNGGDGYWPGLGTSTTAYGNDGCLLADTSQLRPLRGAKFLKADAKDLKKALAVTGVSDLSRIPADDDPETEKDFTAFCADHPDGA
jgi:hypothetical protein